MGNEKGTQAINIYKQVWLVPKRCDTPSFRDYMNTDFEIGYLEQRAGILKQERAGHGARLNKKSITPEEVNRIRERLGVIKTRLERIANDLTKKEEKLKELEKKPEVKAFYEWCEKSSGGGIHVDM